MCIFCYLHFCCREQQILSQALSLYQDKAPILRKTCSKTRLTRYIDKYKCINKCISRYVVVILVCSVFKLKRKSRLNCICNIITAKYSVESQHAGLYMSLLEGMGAYGPLLLAPAEGLGGPSGPLPSGGNLF